MLRFAVVQFSMGIDLQYKPAARTQSTLSILKLRKSSSPDPIPGARPNGSDKTPGVTRYLLHDVPSFISRRQRSSSRLRGLSTRLLLGTVIFYFLGSTPTWAKQAENADPLSKPPLASLIVETEGARVLHAKDANRRHYPASLAKLMSVYLALDAIANHQLSLTQRFTVSAHAAKQPQTHFGFRFGESVDVHTLLKALVVASANDAAVVLAEGMAGSERQFAFAMSMAAQKLGMKNTRFANASGLPAEGQYTTAHDMALLALALKTRFESSLDLFSTRTMSYAGRTRSTHNRFLTSYKGASGMKTGFTCRAGYNLVATAQRNGRKLIGIVLGSPTIAQREEQMKTLLDAAFESSEQHTPTLTLARLALASDQGHDQPLERTSRADGCNNPGPRGWNIQIGVQRSRGEALRLSQRFIRERSEELGGGRALAIPRFTGVMVHQALVTQLSRDAAQTACEAHRKRGQYCVVIGPKAIGIQIRNSKRASRMRALLKRQAEQKN